MLISGIGQSLTQLRIRKEHSEKFHGEYVSSAKSRHYLPNLQLSENLTHPFLETGNICLPVLPTPPFLNYAKLSNNATFTRKNYNSATRRIIPFLKISFLYPNPISIMLRQIAYFERCESPSSSKLFFNSKLSFF